MSAHDPIDGPRLVATAAILDDLLDVFYNEAAANGLPQPDLAEALSVIFAQDDAGEQIRDTAVLRTTAALKVANQEELDARMEEIETGIQVWIDGLAVGIRYARYGKDVSLVTVKGDVSDE